MSDPFDRLAVPPGAVPKETEVIEAYGLQAEDAPPPFDEEAKRPFQQLVELGALVDEFTWAGHSFTIRTLYQGEILQVAKLHADYLNTLGDVKAYQTAVVAACLISYDGKAMPVPLVDNPIVALQDRFRLVSQWYPPTHDAIYSRYLELEASARKAVDAMVKAYG